MNLRLKTREVFLTVFAVVFVSCKSSEPFKLAVLPDTQTYTHLHPEIMKSQMQWVSDNSKDFKFALQQGDITDWSVKEQWEVAADAFSVLDGKLPYTFIPGNHDIGKNSDKRNTDLFNSYFPYDKYSRADGFGGAFEVGKMDNTWHTFKASGIDWLIVSMEFAPRNIVLDWAGEIVKMHPKHKVIINTHAYMYSDNTRMGEGDDWLPKGYGLGKDEGDNAVNDGEQIWDKLVSKHKNIMIVLSGHVLHSGTGTLVSTGINGNKVYQMLANYQAGVDGTVRGGNGFMRILTLDPKNKTIDVKTYSPYINEYKTNPEQQFRFENVDF